MQDIKIVISCCQWDLPISLLVVAGRKLLTLRPAEAHFSVKLANCKMG